MNTTELIFLLFYLYVYIFITLSSTQNTEERNHDLVQVYKNYFERNVNPTNLSLFIDSYVRRTDLNIHRELDPTKKKDNQTLNMPVINITGALSPHVDDTVTLNGRLDPSNSSWMKVNKIYYFVSMINIFLTYVPQKSTLQLMQASRIYHKTNHNIFFTYFFSLLSDI